MEDCSSLKNNNMFVKWGVGEIVCYWLTLYTQGNADFSMNDWVSCFLFPFHPCLLVFRVSCARTYDCILRNHYYLWPMDIVLPLVPNEALYCTSLENRKHFFRLLQIFHQEFKKHLHHMNHFLSVQCTDSLKSNWFNTWRESYWSMSRVSVTKTNVMRSSHVSTFTSATS